MHNIKMINFPYKIQLSATFPYIAELSKNRKEIHTKAYTRKKIKNPVHQQMKRMIWLKFKSFSTMCEFAPRKTVLVIITVYRKGHSSDAHNFAEGVCDALEDAIGVNDRYYQVMTVPMIDKENPRIEVEVLQ